MNSQPSSDVIGSIELELLKLVRQLESFGRRSSLYERVDRAGYLALRTLDEIGPVSTNALASELQLDASTVTRQLTALEKGGLIERRPDPGDGRSTTIVLTPGGRHAMEGLERERRRRMELVVEGWSDTQIASLSSALALLNASLIKSVGPEE
ncbi:MAG TPA: MarR family transcriptional regulator [Acidimicrobiales bacterium]|jgi:DNA-binding MarR family transcriptional regulator|nr:MarR family transcriptional regulator [Acidimicrobiales bacterium]